MRIGPFDTDRIARDAGRAVNDLARGAERAARELSRGAEDTARNVERGVRGAVDDITFFTNEAGRTIGRTLRDTERAATQAAGGFLGAIGGLVRGAADAVAGAADAVGSAARAVVGGVASAIQWVVSGLVDFFVKQPAELAELRGRALAANQGPPAQRLHGTDQDIQDYFDLTSVTYDSDRGMPDGWEEVPNAEARLGVPLEDPETGLRAKVFEKDGTFVLVFEGTRLTQLEDWETNIPQGFGTIPPQYRQALDISLRFKEEFGDEGDLVVTGHSLGGGLATFAGLGAGIETYTFNPSGLGPGSKAFLDEMGLIDRNQHLVVNLIQNGDILDELRYAQWAAMPGFNLATGGSLQLFGETRHVGDFFLNPIEAHLEPDLDAV